MRDAWTRGLRALACAGLVLTVAACASGPPRTYVSEEELHALVEQENLTAEEQDRIVCRREAPTGSRIAVTICRSVRELREAREAVNRGMKTHAIEAGEAP